MNKTIKDITGLKVNRITAISPTNKKKYRSVVWKCQCDCGNYIEVPLRRLTSEKRDTIYSCGCIKNTKIHREKIAGKKTCSRCKETLSLDKFYFLKSKNKPDSLCKECSKEKKRKYKAQFRFEKPRKWRLDNKEIYRRYKKRRMARKKARTKKRQNEKNRISFKKNYKRDKDKIINRVFKYNYGITLEDRNQMIQDQNNKCAICDDIFDFEGNRKIHVDHCHDTGKIRGILCMHCNIFLGKFNDDIFLFKKIIYYIQYYHNIHESVLPYIHKPHHIAIRRNHIMQLQDNRCAICDNILDDIISKGFSKPVLDHDYNTNRERAVLCGRCNTGLGYIERKRPSQQAIANLNNAMQYISKSQEL